MKQSPHLTDIIERQNRIANIQVVFVDVEKYSLRRTVNQVSVIDALTSCMKQALESVSKKYITYAQTNSLNFETDIIRLPTGDGAAIVFSFEGLHDIHLEFAKTLLDIVHRFNVQNPCEKFEQEGWCNCHPCFNLTTGISEGKGIIYKDLNGNYNVAGAVINLAARVMAMADRNQILLSKEAYDQLIEMDEDTHLMDKFVSFEATVKHGLVLQVFQYTDALAEYLNSTAPANLALAKRTDEVMSMLKSTGFPVPDPRSMENIDKNAMMDQMEMMAKFLSSQVNLPHLTKK